MNGFFSRSEMLLGPEAIKKLVNASVLVVGLGGVGSYTVEALVRSGISRVGLCDADTVSKTNINRQLYALVSTVGMKKTDVAKKRVLDINPCVIVDTYDFFFDENSAHLIDFDSYDYVVDAIDSMDSKVLLIKTAHLKGIGIISALSAGNKLDPYKFEPADIYSTSVCPVARLLRKRLREENIDHHKVIYSKEPPVKLYETEVGDSGKKNVGSVSFVPSVMGLFLAREVVLDLIERESYE